LANDDWSKRTLADREYQANAVLLLEKLVANNPDELIYQFDLMRSLAEINVFDPDLDSMAIDEAYEALQKAIAYGQALTQVEPDIVDYRIELIHTHFKLGRIAELKSQYSESPEREELLQAKEQLYRKATLAQSVLVRQYPEATVYKIWLVRFSLSLAACETMADRIENQKRMVGRAIAILNRLPDELSELPEVMEIMAEAKEMSRQLLMEPEVEAD
jgi:hypothetical protein